MIALDLIHIEIAESTDRSSYRSFSLSLFLLSTTIKQLDSVEMDSSKLLVVHSFNDKPIILFKMNSNELDC